MPPRSGQRLPRGLDDYAAHRCVNCKHLRYAGQAPGDPCRYCPCAEHVLPYEAEAGQAPTGGAA